MKIIDVTNKIEKKPKSISKGDDFLDILESDFIPSFIEGSKVKLNVEHISYTSDLKSLVGKVLTVRFCKLANLGDMAVEVLYIEPIDKKTIRNPYIAEHFIQV